MDVKDFKKQLFTQLQSSGILNSLKGQLRAKLLAEIRGKQPAEAADAELPGGGGRAGNSLLTRVVNSLICDYFEGCGFHYSLSVFQPESGLGGHSSTLSRKEVMQALCLDRRSPLFHSIGSESALIKAAAPGKGGTDAAEAVAGQAPTLLEALLQAMVDLAQAPERGCEAGVQTADAVGSATKLALQLGQVEEVYMQASQGEHAKPFVLLEKRMAQYRQECDQRVKEEVALQVERVRELEVGSLRLEEAARWRKAVEKERTELDRLHVEQVQQLREREQQAVDRIRRLQREAEAEAYAARQRALQEEDRVRGWKSELQAELAQRREEAAALDKQLQDRQVVLAGREVVLEQRLAQVDAALAEADARARKKLEQEFVEQRAELRSERQQLERTRAEVAEAKQRASAEIAATRGKDLLLQQAEASRAVAEAQAKAHAEAERKLQAQADRLAQELAQARQQLAQQAAAMAAELRGRGPAGGPVGVQESGNPRQSLLNRGEAGGRHHSQLQAAAAAAEVAAAREVLWRERAAKAEALVDEASSEREVALQQVEEVRLLLSQSERSRAELQEEVQRLEAQLARARSAPPGAAASKAQDAGQLFATAPAALQVATPWDVPVDTDGSLAWRSGTLQQLLQLPCAGSALQQSFPPALPSMGVRVSRPTSACSAAVPIPQHASDAAPGRRSTGAICDVGAGGRLPQHLRDLALKEEEGRRQLEQFRARVQSEREASELQLRRMKETLRERGSSLGGGMASPDLPLVRQPDGAAFVSGTPQQRLLQGPAAGLEPAADTTRSGGGQGYLLVLGSELGDQMVETVLEGRDVRVPEGALIALAGSDYDAAEPGGAARLQRISIEAVSKYVDYRRFELRTQQQQRGGRAVAEECAAHPPQAGSRASTEPSPQPAPESQLHGMSSYSSCRPAAEAEAKAAKVMPQQPRPGVHTAPGPTEPRAAAEQPVPEDEAQPACHPQASEEDPEEEPEEALAAAERSGEGDAAGAAQAPQPPAEEAEREPGESAAAVVAAEPFAAGRLYDDDEQVYCDDEQAPDAGLFESLQHGEALREQQQPALAKEVAIPTRQAQHQQVQAEEVAVPMRQAQQQQVQADEVAIPTRQAQQQQVQAEEVAVPTRQEQPQPAQAEGVAIPARQAEQQQADTPTSAAVVPLSQLEDSAAQRRQRMREAAQQQQALQAARRLAQQQLRQTLPPQELPSTGPGAASPSGTVGAGQAASEPLHAEATAEMQALPESVATEPEAGSGLPAAASTSPPLDPGDGIAAAVDVAAEEEQVTRPAAADASGPQQEWRAAVDSPSRFVGGDTLPAAVSPLPVSPAPPPAAAPTASEPAGGFDVVEGSEEQLELEVAGAAAGPAVPATGAASAADWVEEDLGTDLDVVDSFGDELDLSIEDLPDEDLDF